MDSAEVGVHRLSLLNRLMEAMVEAMEVRAAMEVLGVMADRGAMADLECMSLDGGGPEVTLEDLHIAHSTIPNGEVGQILTEQNSGESSKHL